MMSILQVTLLTLTIVALKVEGHGRMTAPAGRSSMWRYGCTTCPVNYDDNSLNCGGSYVQHVLNGGKCGMCGDPFGETTPRSNEDGGYYGLGIIAATYQKGQTIVIEIEITANQKGWVEFKICPTAPATQACFDANVLTLTAGGTKFYLPANQVGSFLISAQLPANLICYQCVLQWRYHTGKDWNCDDDTDLSTCCTGCGPQEEFYSCADIEITESGNSEHTTTTSTTTTTTPTTPYQNAGGSPCYGKYINTNAMDHWCTTNCNHIPAYCPDNLCVCPPYQGIAGRRAKRSLLHRMFGHKHH